METLGKIPVVSLVFLVASLDYVEVPSSQPPANRTTYQLTMKTKIAFVSFCVLIQAVVCSAEDRRGPFTHARTPVGAYAVCGSAAYLLATDVGF